MQYASKIVMLEEHLTEELGFDLNNYDYKDINHKQLAENLELRMFIYKSERTSKDYQFFMDEFRKLIKNPIIKECNDFNYEPVIEINRHVHGTETTLDSSEPSIVIRDVFAINSFSKKEDVLAFIDKKFNQYHKDIKKSLPRCGNTKDQFAYLELCKDRKILEYLDLKILQKNVTEFHVHSHYFKEVNFLKALDQFKEGDSKYNNERYCECALGFLNGIFIDWLRSK